MADPITGSPPSPEQEAAFAAAANLTPEKSLTRIQELAKFVFSNIAIVGTLLTGLGLFTDLGEVVDDSWKIGDIPLPVLFAGLSLFGASCAIWPKMQGVELGQLDQVEDWYRRQIIRRGLWMIFSLTLFSLAILTATFTGISGDGEQPEKPSISASWTGTPDKATVKVTAEAEEVPDGWMMETTVWAKEKGTRTRIFSDRTSPNADGALKVAGEIALSDLVGVKPKSVESKVRLFDPDGDKGDTTESTMTLAHG